MKDRVEGYKDRTDSVVDPMTFLDIYSEEWSDPENAAKYTPPLGPVWDG